MFSLKVKKSLLITHYSLLITHYSLLITHALVKHVLCIDICQNYVVPPGVQRNPLSNVPECNYESSLQRRDYAVCIQDILIIQDPKVIVRCVHLCKLVEQESVCRPLLVSFDKPETVSQYHGNEKGVKCKDSYRINPDL